MSRQWERARFPGESHPQAKLTEADVALARLIARDASLPMGWMKELARTYGVTLSTLSSAIGGQTWRELTNPAPVPSGHRHKRGPRGAVPRHCPHCGRVKARGLDCGHAFHRFDHRSLTSPQNAKKARDGRA